MNFMNMYRFFGLVCFIYSIYDFKIIFFFFFFIDLITSNAFNFIHEITVESIVETLLKLMNNFKPEQDGPANVG
jgi:hypothetical protein